MPLCRDNKGHKLINSVIDIFSERALEIPIKNKSGKVMLTAVDAHPRKPSRVQTNDGKEFLKKFVKGFVKREGVQQFVSNSEQKDALVMRFNGTLKARIRAYFTPHQRRHYLVILPKIFDT